ncbi:hypothetical protein KAW65_02735 [candidate division WOR-3 bacterium]|nr:hypothetical protein [candidate division WOR-3 bacterium]
MNIDKDDKFDLIYNIVTTAAANILDPIEKAAKKIFKNENKPEVWDLGFLEIVVFLLFEVDFAMNLFKQDRKIRESLIIYLIDNFIKQTDMKEFKLFLKKLFNQRCLEYSEIVNSKEYRKTQKIELIIEPLFNNVLLAINNGEINLKKEGIRPLSLDFWGLTLARESYFDSGFRHHFGLKIYLKHILQNNTNFTLISQDEIDDKIIDANKEIESLLKKRRIKENKSSIV